MKDSLRPESESRSTLQKPCRPEDDLKALARLSKRNLPTIEDSMRALAERQNARSREGFMTELVRKASNTPWLPPVAAGAVAAILLFVPISYDKTTSYDVKLKFKSSQVADAQIDKIATEMQKALHVQGFNMNRSGDEIVLSTTVPVAQAAGVAGVARAFAAELKSRQIDTEAVVTPVTTKVMGNVYAMAMSRVINVNVDTNGKTDAQVSEDIKKQLQDAGFAATNVEYTTDGDKHTLKIINESHDPNAPHDDANAPEVNLTINGQAPPADAKNVRLKIENQPGDTDATIRQRIVDQLKSQGVDATVVVRDGKVVSIDPIKH